MSKSKATNALGRVQIEQIDADGNMIERWVLWNAWIKDVKFGDLDYDGDDLTDIEIELRYDWAYLETAENGANGAGNTYWNPGSP